MKDFFFYNNLLKICVEVVFGFIEQMGPTNFDNHIIDSIWENDLL